MQTSLSATMDWQLWSWWIWWRSITRRQYAPTAWALGRISIQLPTSQKRQDFQGRNITFCQELVTSKDAINAQVYLPWSSAICYDQISSGHLQRLMKLSHNWPVFDLPCRSDFLLSSSSLILAITKCISDVSKFFEIVSPATNDVRFPLTYPLMLQTRDSHALHPIQSCDQDTCPLTGGTWMIFKFLSTYVPQHIFHTQLLGCLYVLSFA